MNMTILLDDGSGGRASQRLIKELFFRHLGNPVLERMDDAALLDIKGPIAMSTDGYTVDPLEFPGGNIGSLAVHGTVNDVCMLGARPMYLACAFILEEGIEVALLDRIVASMAEAAHKAGVLVVTGDTKVVPKGAADTMFITTTGIGEVIVADGPSGSKAQPGDVVLVSGSMGDHGLAIMGTRTGLSLASGVQSDSAALNHMVLALIEEVGSIHVLRDPTRGGLGSTLNEIAEQSGVTITVREAAIPVTEEVKAGCAVLGLDPLFLANEGKLICIVPEEKAEACLAVMRRFEEGRGAVVIGEVSAGGTDTAGLLHGNAYSAGKGMGAVADKVGTQTGLVLLETPLGGKRLLGMLEGEQLPRIC